MVDGQSVDFFVRSVSLAPDLRYCVILMDVSGSVAPVFPEVKAAVTELATNLVRDKTRVKLMPFSTEVHADLPWTSDATVISQDVKRLQAGGGTALYRALRAAADELAKSPAPELRTIILFTDGKNEDANGRVALAEVLDQLTAHNVAVYAVGLQTKDLEPAVLKRLACKPDAYLEAANSSELSNRFATTSDSLRRNRYRLAIPMASLARHPGEHSVLAEVRPQGLTEVYVERKPEN